jgi:hypothetical protein
MLNCDLSGIEEDLIKRSNNSITITYSNIENKEGYELKYSIANTWYASNAYNTIRCNLTSKTGVIYEAIKDLTFGKANSQGSNLSLVLSYTDNKNAYEVKTDSNNQILSRPQMEIQGLIYDLSGKTIPSNGSWEWVL